MRYLKDVPRIKVAGVNTETLYNQIKTHIKTSEYRELNEYWTKILITNTDVITKILNGTYNGYTTLDLTRFLRHHKAIFIEGYPKGKIENTTHLDADVTGLTLWLKDKIYEIKIANAIEIKGS